MIQQLRKQETFFKSVATTDPIVLCASDDNYIMPLAVTLHSAASNLKPGNHLHVLLMDGGISEASWTGLRETLLDLPMTIHVMRPDKKEVSDLGISHHITHTAYFRLLAARLLPDSIDKVIYLDSDVLVQGDLTELWNYDVGDNYCLAAVDISCPYINAYEAQKKFGDLKKSLHLGQSDTNQFTVADLEKIKAQNLDVEQKSSDQPPTRLLNKIGWYTEATLNQIATWTGNTTSAKPEPETHDSLKLSDFRWPWAISAFAESVENFRPNTVLVQYVKLAYLLEGLSSENRNSICCMLDTHDVLHLRNQRFRENGHQHWIDIDRKTESEAIRKFDIALAIQPEEAKVINQMAPDTKTIVCGHASFNATHPETVEENPTTQPEETKSKTHTLKVGYLGSLNASNKEAVRNLLTVLADQLGSNEAIQIIIAGAICQCLDSESIPPNVSDKVILLGRVEDLNEFYDEVDLVMNPVTFGTGLKIKNTEALSFGKPLITTHHGVEGMKASNSDAIIVCKSAVEICQELLRLTSDHDKLARLKTAARLAAQNTTPDKVYASLLAALLKN